MSAKGRRTDAAIKNSINHMRGMHDYKCADGRTYQTEKRLARMPEGRRILSPEERKERADAKTTPRAIRRMERYLDLPVTPLEEIEEKYGLFYDEEKEKVHGKADHIFEIFKSKVEALAFYDGWTDVYMSMYNNWALRTKPEEKKKIPEGMRKTSSVEPFYSPGDKVWTYEKLQEDVKCYSCNGRGYKWGLEKKYECGECNGTGKIKSYSGKLAAIQAEIKSWYKKKTGKGLDIMYELIQEGQDEPFWRLQSKGVFATEEEAEKYVLTHSQ